MLNKNQLMKLYNLLVRVDDGLSKSKFGVRFYDALRQRLDNSKVLELGNYKPSTTELNKEDLEELREIFINGSLNRNANSIKINKYFTMIGFDIDGDPSYIATGHLDIEQVKDILLKDLSLPFYSYLARTSKNDALRVGYGHYTLPDFTNDRGEVVNEMYVNKKDFDRFRALMDRGVIDITYANILIIRGIKYDLDFGKEIA